MHSSHSAGVGAGKGSWGVNEWRGGKSEEKAMGGNYLPHAVLGGCIPVIVQGCVLCGRGRGEKRGSGEDGRVVACRMQSWGAAYQS